MSKTINDLPDEVLAEIFAYLNAESLKHACDTLRRWNELIHTSRHTRNRLTTVVTSELAETFLEFDNHSLQRHPNYWEIATQLYWISLDRVVMNAPGLNEFIAAKSPYVRRLTVRFVENGEVQPTLEQLPRLEILEIIDEIKFSSPEPIFLANLKVLKINVSCVDILEKIQVTKSITEFSITSLKMDGTFAKVARFLMRCPALKKLTVWIQQASPRVLSEMFDQSGLSAEVPFRLKYLEMRGFHSLRTEQNISNFLKLHAETLEHFDIQGQRFGMNQELCREVLTSFPKLKTLKINGRCFPEEKSFYICLDPLQTVTDLTVMGEIPKHQSAKVFYALFPSIEKLTVDPFLSYFPKFFKLLNEVHPNLQHLSYSSFRKGTPLNLHFENLKYLAVHEVKDKPAFMNFVLCHRNLVSVTIGDIFDLKDEDISDILKLPLLRNIELGAKTKADIKRVFDLIKRDFKRLQSAKFSYKLDPDHECLKHQEILFPLEKKFWNPKQYKDFFDN